MSLVTRIVVALAAAALTAAAFWLVGEAVRDTTMPVLREMTVPAPGLDREVTILHVTDFHGADFGPGQERVTALLGDRKVDAVVFTGDLIAHHWGDRTAIKALVRALAPKTGAMLYVPGNHDDAALGGELRPLGVVTIMPGRVVTLTADPGVEFVSADTDWRIAAWPHKDAAALVVAMHQPPDDVLLRRAARLTVGTQVVLAGHTHGGQMRVPGIGALIAPTAWGGDNDLSHITDQVLPELRGAMIDGEYRRGRQVVDVSAGLGTSKVPVRLFAPAEVTLVRLVPAH